MGLRLDGLGLRVLGIPSMFSLFLSIPSVESREWWLTTSRKVPTALADHVEKNKLEGKMRYALFVGASSGAETEGRWAQLNMIERRSPHQVGKDIAKGLNTGQINFFDKHLSLFPSDLVNVSFPVC